MNIINTDFLDVAVYNLASHPTRVSYVLNQNERTNRPFLHLYFLLPNIKASTGNALPLLPNITTWLKSGRHKSNIFYKNRMLQETVFDQSVSKYEMMYLTGNGNNAYHMRS